MASRRLGVQERLSYEPDPLPRVGGPARDQPAVGRMPPQSHTELRTAHHRPPLRASGRRIVHQRQPGLAGDRFWHQPACLFTGGAGRRQLRRCRGRCRLCQPPGPAYPAQPALPPQPDWNRARVVVPLPRRAGRNGDRPVGCLCLGWHGLALPALTGAWRPACGRHRPVAAGRGSLRGRAFCAAHRHPHRAGRYLATRRGLHRLATAARWNHRRGQRRIQRRPAQPAARHQRSALPGSARRPLADSRSAHRSGAARRSHPKPARPGR